MSYRWFPCFMSLAAGYCEQASAQSSVTLYGIIDESIQYVHNNAGKSNSISMQSGQMSLSQWGLKGTEDLGGGTSAVFDLENQFDASNGREARPDLQFEAGYDFMKSHGDSSATYQQATLAADY